MRIARPCVCRLIFDSPMCSRLCVVFVKVARAKFVERAACTDLAISDETREPRHATIKPGRNMKLAAFVLAFATSTAALRAGQSTPLLKLRGGGGQPTPAENYAAYSSKGGATASMDADKAFFASFHSGLHVSSGALFALTVAGGIRGLDAMERRFVFTALFPWAMFVIMQAGGQLYTGNTSSMTAALLEGKITLQQLLRGLAISAAGNFAGAAGFAFMAKAAGVITPATGELAASFATKKLGTPANLVFLRGILCNWLVCLAILLSTGAQSLWDKIISAYFPIMTFIALGLEHSVANAAILPMGLFGGADFSWMDVITKNILPVAVANGIGGAVLVAASQSFLFGKLGQKA